jgi:hypothetical protein
MKFLKIMTLAALVSLPGTVVQVYGQQEKRDEKQAKPEKQQAQPQQHAQQPKQQAQSTPVVFSLVHYRYPTTLFLLCGNWATHANNAVVDELYI